MKLLQAALGGRDVASGGGPFRWQNIMLLPLGDVAGTGELMQKDRLYSYSFTEKRWQVQQAPLAGSLPDPIVSFTAPAQVSVLQFCTHAEYGAPENATITAHLLSGGTRDLRCNNIYHAEANFSQFVPGSFARHCADQIDSRIAGQTPSVAKPIFATQDHANAVYVRNTACWGANLDLTGLSPWNSYGGATRAGTLISDDALLCANHYPIPDGTTIRFVAADNSVVERTTISGAQVSTSDLFVCRLNAALPAGIHRCQLLPPDYARYVPAPALGPSNFMVPLAFTDQEEKLLVGEFLRINDLLPNASASFMISSDATRASFWESLIGGDSGDPIFFIVNAQPVLLTVATSPGGGSFTVAFHVDLAATLNSLGAQPFTFLDLTTFPNYV